MYLEMIGVREAQEDVRGLGGASETHGIWKEHSKPEPVVWPFGWHKVATK